VFGLLVAFAPATCRAEAPTPIKKFTTIEGVTEYRLDNGLRVLLYADASTPKLTVISTVFVGSRHEGYGETGMAHLLEHMNCKCTPTQPNIKKALSDRGASFNATTSKDRTNYFETLEATDDNLEFAIRLEADRLVNSLIRREDLVSEMTVVRNEFEMAENDPEGVLRQRLFAAAFEWHNYAKSILGNRADIERMPIENLRAFYRKHYRPDNAMLIVSGKFEPAKALVHIAKYFGPVRNPANQLRATYTLEPAQDGERNVVLRRVGATGLVAAIYHIPAAAHPDFAPLRVLAQVLGTVPSGRLYREMVVAKKSSRADAYVFPMHDPGVFLAAAQVEKEQSAESVRQTLLDLVEKLGTNKITDKEVEQARAELTNGWDLMTSHDIANGLCEWAARGDWRLLFVHRDRLAKVTAEDVNRVAAQYLVRTNRTVGMYIPSDKPERLEVPETPDLAVMLKDYKGGKAIAAGEEFDPTPENIEKRVLRAVLPSGVKTALLPRESRGQTVILELTLRYGNVESLAGRVTAADFLPAMMLRGTRQHDFKALDLALTQLDNAGISTGGGLGYAVFTVQCKRQHLGQALTLLGEVLREPTFPKEEFETLKRATIEQVRSRLNETNALAGVTLLRKLDPRSEDHVRYVPTLEERIARLEATTVDQVRQLYGELLGGQCGELAVVGDFDPDQVLRQMQDILKDWKARTTYKRIPAPANTEVGASYDVIETPDKANAIYAAAHVIALRDTDADHAALLVVNYLLGGAPSSRLWKRIREQEGLSYHVDSAYSADALDPAAIFAFSAICNPKNMPKVRKAMAEEIDKVLKEGVTAAEVEDAKQAILEQRKGLTDGQIAGLLSDYLFLGQTFADRAERNHKISQVTVKQVNAALRKHLRPERLIIVEAGEFKKAASQP
jgi:zinc protease